MSVFNTLKEKVYKFLNKIVLQKYRPYSEYRDLAPIDDIENGDEYINAMNWAFKNKKIKNIALAGPYGSGKSSIIDTFLKRHKFLFLKRKYLKISLATFTEGLGESSGSEKITLSPAEIEQGILKQLFYKVKSRQIPQSRYRKLHKVGFISTFLTVLFSMAVIAIVCTIFLPNTYSYAVDALKRTSNVFGLSIEWVTIGILVLFLFLTFAITVIYVRVISRLRISEVKLPADTSVSTSEKGGDEKSIFNKNLDEIIYFFEATKYSIVFFEDLDRLKDKKIFVHLRELNNLLNNNDAISRKPVVFVYAVKDDLFSKDDRTKFFDFIIPVVPVINATNSGEILLKRFSEAKDNGINHHVSEGFILDISPYISDMRTLQNIYNEFVVYKQTLAVDQDLKLDDEKILALIVLKNLQPGVFADLQAESGLVKIAFAEKEDFITEQQNALKAAMDEIMDKIKIIQADSLQSLSEIKIALAMQLVEWKGFPRFFCFSQNGSSSDLSMTDYLKDEYDLNEFLEKKYLRVNSVTFINNSASTKSINDFKSVIAPYIIRWNARKKEDENGVAALSLELQKLKNQQRAISVLPLKELFELNPNVNFGCEEVASNKLLMFLLRRGYIDERYATFINYFKGTTVTKDDMNFILSVKDREKQPFNYTLTRISMVVKRLQEHEFAQREVYNFDLLEELLTNYGDSKKLMNFMGQLADGRDDSWSFIDEFVDRTNQKQEFVKSLACSWPQFWLAVSSKVTLTYERKLQYLEMLLSFLNIEDIMRQNEQNCVSKFFEEHPDILKQLETVKSQVIISVIDELDISFRKLETEDVDADILNFIFDEQHYELNWDMVQTIVSYKNITLLAQLSTQPYSTIVELNYSPLLSNVHENIVKYVTEMILTKESVRDHTQDVLDLLQRLISNSRLCVALVNKEQFSLAQLSSCVSDLIESHGGTVENIWIALMDTGKVEPTWENAVCYWENFGLEGDLQAFITNNVDKMLLSDCNSVPDEFISDFISANFTSDIQKKVLPILRISTFNLDITSLSEETISIMIGCHYFPFTAAQYGVIAATYPLQAYEYILANQQDYMDCINEIAMSDEMFEQLMFDSRFEQCRRQLVFDKYATTHMTEKVAKHVSLSRQTVTLDVFDVVWQKLPDLESALALMYANLSVLNANDFEKYFGDLTAGYEQMADRSKRHEVDLPFSVENLQLAERLKDIDYITRSEQKERTLFDSVLGVETKEPYIMCRIKQKKTEE